MKRMRLKKELTLLTATLYGVGIILGAGIYVLIGEGAAIAGNAVWISFVIAAAIAVLTGLSYAELSGMFARDAAEYVYTRHAFHLRSVPFILQWVMIFALIVSASTVALGFGGYFSSVFGVRPLDAAIGLIVVLSLINYIGIKESARFNVFSTLVELSGLIIVIAIGVFFIGSANIDYFATPGIMSIFSATALIFFAFIGFEEMVNLSEETKNAQKIIPKAVVLALVISTALYILVSISAVSVVGADALAESPAPLAVVIGKVLPQGATAVSFIALFATANTVLVTLIVVSRMLYGLSCNSSLPGLCRRVGRRGTPYVSVFIVMLLGIFFLFLGGVKTVALLTDMGIFIIYIFINAAVILLRYQNLPHKRTFRTPLNIGRFPVLPLLGIVSSVLMLAQFEHVFFLYEMLIAGTGFLFYLLYSRANQKEAVPSA